MASSSTSDLKEPVLRYDNWAEWSAYWHDHLVALDLWQFTDPNTQTTPPPPNTSLNRKIYDSATENYRELRKHVSPDCRSLLAGHTNLRSLWTALKEGTDRGTKLPLLAKLEQFHGSKWEPKDTISSYTARLRDLYLALENSPYQLHRDVAVHTMISRLPDCFRAEGHSANQQNLSFIGTTAYLLANIKDSVASGDNLTGQALHTRGRQPNQNSRGLDRHRSRGRGRGYGRSRHRSPYPQHPQRSSNPQLAACHWCKKQGHYERDCMLRLQQLNDGTARRDRHGRVYLVSQNSPRLAPPTNYTFTPAASISAASTS